MVVDINTSITCSAGLKAGQAHLLLQLLVLRGDGLPHGHEAAHRHAHRLAHPVDGGQRALRLVGLVLVIDQRGDLDGRE